MTPNFIKTNIKKFFFKHGFDCVITKRIDAGRFGGATLLNIGAGDWECDGWINLDHSSKTYATSQKRHKYVEYDIRHDKLPYADNSVDAIYCSHVIEHIENRYVAAMLKECQRVLKPGGIVRITCPDAEFLYKMTTLGNRNFWIRRKAELTQHGIDFDSWNIINFFVREIAAPITHGFGHKEEPKFDYYSLFKKISMEEFMDKMTEGLEFDESNVGSHINWWTVKKLTTALEGAGFHKVIESKCGGSISKYMISRAYFDTSAPWCSLYVEAEK